MSDHPDFKTLGFSTGEAEIYLDLADVGRSTAHAISKRTKIPRTTVYWVLDNLEQRGVVSIEQRKGVTFFSINRPEALVRMVQKERESTLERLKQKEDAARTLAAAVKPYFKDKHYSVPKLQFFEGKENVEAMLFDYLPIWQESMAQYDFTWWGYQDHTFAEHYLGWLKHTWKERRPDEKDKILTNRSDIEDKLKIAAPHRGIKFIAPSFNFSSTIWIAGDYLVMIMTSQKPHYAMQMKDAFFASNIRSVFQLLWETI